MPNINKKMSSRLSSFKTMSTLNGTSNDIIQNGDNNIKSSVLAMGCFWAPDSIYGVTKGVLRTKVGYSGGKIENPTYRDMNFADDLGLTQQLNEKSDFSHLSKKEICSLEGVGYNKEQNESKVDVSVPNRGDHTEVIKIDYDSKIISFENILKIFWKNHDPTNNNKKQYRSMIFYNNEEDKKIAEKSLKEESLHHSLPITTIIVPFKRFYDAEDYHQKYRLRQHTPLVSKLNFENQNCFKTSKIAARLNGYLVGLGGVSQLDEEAEELGLNEEMKEYVKKYLIHNQGVGSSCGRKIH